MGIEHFHLIFSVGLGFLGSVARFAPLPGQCAELSRAGRRGALRGEACRCNMTIVI
jgi:hypothetical protein